MSTCNSLNPNRKEAVFCTKGLLLVLAGASSERTGMLTRRIAYLIEKKGVDPWNIIVITFTDKAAGGMRERVGKQVGLGSESVQVNTFHSTCVRILRQYTESLGYSTNFTIYDSGDQKALLEQVLRKLGIDTKMYREWAVAEKVSNTKGKLVTPEEFLLNASGNFREQKMGQICEEYQSQLKKNNALNFNDLIMKTVRLFQNCPGVLDYCQEHFRYIMVDGCQDTNAAQFKLTSLLAGEYKNPCVIGDGDRSIYKLRGINIRNILNFEKSYPGAKVMKLGQNYRSAQNVLDSANAVIRNDKGGKDRTLWTANGRSGEIRFYQFDQVYEETDFIVKDARENEYPCKDCVVLYWTNAQSRPLEERYIVYNVPCWLVGGMDFYQKKKIRDVLVCLKTIANGVDDIAISCTFNMSERGVGLTTLGRVTVFASTDGTSLRDALLRTRVVPDTGKTAERIGRFTNLVEESRREVNEEDYSIQDLIEVISEDTGCRAEPEDEDEAKSQTRLEDTEGLINKTISHIEGSEHPTLGEFLEEVALVADIDQMDESESRVTLMTFHGAKGPGFPRVYLSGMDDGLFPEMMSVSFGDPTELEEGQRLYYISITRAREDLTMTSSRQRMINGGTRYPKMSRFMDEVSEGLLGTSRLEPRLSSRRNADKVYDSNLPWNKTKRPTGVSSFGTKSNAYASKIMPSGRLAFGRAFTIEKTKGLDYQMDGQVMHVKFGCGIVLGVKDGDKDYGVTVCSDTVGVKKMFASFTKLEETQNY